MNKQKNTHKLHVVIETDNTIVHRDVHIVPHSGGWEIFPSLGMEKTFFNTQWEAFKYLDTIHVFHDGWVDKTPQAVEDMVKVVMGNYFEEYVEHG